MGYDRTDCSSNHLPRGFENLPVPSEVSTHGSSVYIFGELKNYKFLDISSVLENAIVYWIRSY